MDILDARVSQVKLSAEQDPNSHVDALFVKSVAQGVITKIEVRQGDNHAWPGQDRPNDVIGPQGAIRLFEPTDVIRDRVTIQSCYS